jgi:hypothetical protein
MIAYQSQQYGFVSLDPRVKLCLPKDDGRKKESTPNDDSKTYSKRVSTERKIKESRHGPQKGFHYKENLLPIHHDITPQNRLF